MTIKLVKYDEVQADNYMDYILEWEATGELIVPYASSRRGMTFGVLQKDWQLGETDEAYDRGFVPSTLYFLVAEANRIIGAIHFRHELNDRLRADGGHIGYGIRPGERKKGYATMMVELLLKKLGDDYDQVMISCGDKNTASAKTIEHNGGVLEDIVERGGGFTRRYWIKLN